MHDSESMHIIEALSYILHDLLGLREVKALHFVYALEESASLKVLSQDVDGGGGLVDAVNFQYIFMFHSS